MCLERTYREVEFFGKKNLVILMRFVETSFYRLFIINMALRSLIEILSSPYPGISNNGKRGAKNNKFQQH